MKFYVGIKMVQAEPMKKDEVEGYKVIYENGYESWSPKDVFEKAYFFCLDENTGKEFVNKLSESLKILSEMCEFAEFKQSKETKHG